MINMKYKPEKHFRNEETRKHFEDILKRQFDKAHDEIIEGNKNGDDEKIKLNLNYSRDFYEIGKEYEIRINGHEEKYKSLTDLVE